MKDETLYSVYCHTAPDGRKYVGISYDPKKRWHSGAGYKRNKGFYEAICRYGWDNFKHEILCEGLTYQFAKMTEYNYIKEWDLLNKKKGFNLSPSGDASNVTEETREKMRQICMGNKRSLGHRHPEERKRKISESLKKHYAPSPEHPEGLRGSNYGRKFSAETRRKMSEHMKSLPPDVLKKMGDRLPHKHGAECYNAKAVIRTDAYGDEMRFDCISDAIRFMGSDWYKRQGILRCCNGIQEKYKGYSWKYA